MRVRLPPVHPAQQVVLDAWRAPGRACGGAWAYRYFVLRWGRRAGKTRLAVLLTIAAALSPSHAGRGNSGGAVWWVAPTFPHARVAWRLMLSLASQIPTTKIDRANMRIALPGGGWVQVKSAKDPTALRSEGLDLVVVDEAAFIPSRKWPQVWKQALRPALADRLGRAMFISTPNGFNHFYDLWQEAVGAPDWFTSHLPAWENPWIAPSEIEDARRDLPEAVFRQEYGAEFVDVAGSLFRREWLKTTPVPAERMVALARGWDIAVTPGSGDYTVGALVGMGESGTLYVLDVVRGQWEFPDVVAVIRQTALRDGSTVPQLVESGGTQKGLYQTLAREPALVVVPLMPVTPEARDKVTRALPLVTRVKTGGLRILAAPWADDLISEMVAFPQGEYDDQVDALVYAVHGLSLGRAEAMPLPEAWQ